MGVPVGPGEPTKPKPPANVNNSFAKNPTRPVSHDNSHAVMPYQNSPSTGRGQVPAYINIPPKDPNYPDASRGGAGAGASTASTSTGAPDTTPNSSGTPVIVPNKPGPKENMLNIPMVAAAYFHSESGTPSGFPAGSNAIDYSHHDRLKSPMNNAQHGRYLYPGGYRQYQKGYIIQDNRFSASWTVNNVRNGYGPAADPKTPLYDKYRWGFRFLWNPAAYDMSYGVMDDIDPSLLISGVDSSVPLRPASQGGAMATIQLQLDILRIEDFKHIIYKQDQRTGAITSAAYSGNPYPLAHTPSNDIAYEIATRGTMYDLEFLFRTLTGRPFKTKYRNVTSDIGVYFPVPIVLRLSQRMVYSGRVTGLNIKHSAFTPNMVPIATSVTINITRIPDAVGMLGIDNSGTTAQPVKADVAAATSNSGESAMDVLSGAWW